MREYEIMVITKPDLPETDVTKTVERWENIIKTEGGEILKKDNWGAKRLAYSIQKFNRGVYHVYNVATKAENVKELDRVMGIDEGVLRNMIIQVAERCDVEGRKAELSKQDFGPKHRDFDRARRGGPGGGRGGFGDRGEGFGGGDRDFEDRPFERKGASPRGFGDRDSFEDGNEN